MKKSRLSTYKQGRLIEHFVSGSTACVNKATAAYSYQRLREIIAYEIDEDCHEVLGGEIVVDESNFGGRRKDKRGRVAARKIPVFGLLKRVETI